MSQATQLALLGGAASLCGMVLALRRGLRIRRERGQLRRRLGQIRHLCYVCDPLVLRPRAAASPR